MSDPSDPLASLPSVLRRERLCDEFEKAWKDGARPALGEFLAQVPPEDQPKLLSDLLAIDFDYRQDAGETPRIDDYLTELAAFSVRLREALSENPTKPRLADSFSTINEPPATALPEAPLPTRCGEYEILGEIARGGMGVVYKARHVRLGRLAAIKQVLSGSRAGAEEISRFQIEAAAAARLDHPGIVPIFEAGEADGLPYLAMAFVEGRSLSQIIRESPLECRAAAKMIMEAAQAVDYAHRQGVLHRDLKPQNILVTADGHPRVTDFGLAKMRLTESELTVTGQVIGTPSYMPPEQASGNAGDVGPASDVYSLGATLYAALSGHPPFLAATTLETLRQVVDQAPPPLRALNRGIDRDLETICLKCLHKEPSRRYASAAELADDLGRYLKGAPILARPTGAIERIWRWGRRNKRLAAAIGAAHIALLATVVTLATSAVLIADSRNEALTEKSEAERQRDRANGNYRVARDAVDRYLRDIANADELKSAPLEQLRRNLLVTGNSFYKQFATTQTDDPDLIEDHGRAMLQMAFISDELGEHDQALAQLADAQELLSKVPAGAARRRAVRCLLGEAKAEEGRIQKSIGKNADAEKALREAVAIFREELPAAPANDKMQKGMTRSLLNLALILQDSGQTKDAESLLREAEGVGKSLVKDHSDELPNREVLSVVQVMLGRLYVAQSRAADARPVLERGIVTLTEIAKQKPNSILARQGLGYAHTELAEVHRLLGDKEAEIREFQAALAVRSSLAEEHPAAIKLQSDLAVSRTNLATSLQAAGKLSEAGEQIGGAVQVLRRLAADYPSILRFRAQLGSSLITAGDLDTEQSRPQAADAFKEALSVFERLLQEDPKALQFRENLAISHWRIAESDSTQASSGRERALELFQQLARENPEIPRFGEIVKKLEGELAAPP